MSHSRNKADAKRELREVARRARSDLSAEHREQAADALAATDLSALGSLRGKIVASYHPMRDEVDPMPLIERLRREEGAASALPAIQPDSATLVFRLWQPGDPVTRAMFSTVSPLPNAQAVEPDILFVPMLAFDAAGHRLGYGRGFYDRALTTLRSRRAVTAVGLAFDEQEVPRVPHEERDERLDWLLTPKGLRRV